MRAFQPGNRPATSLRFCSCVIIDRRRLDEAGRDMAPVGEFQCVVEPTDMHPWTISFEPCERHRVARRDIYADRGHAMRITGKPSRPGWKHAIGFDDALDEIEQGWRDREGDALRRGHIAIHDDDAPCGHPGRQIRDQQTRWPGLVPPSTAARGPDARRGARRSVGSWMAGPGPAMTVRCRQLIPASIPASRRPSTDRLFAA